MYVPFKTMSIEGTQNSTRVFQASKHPAK